MNNGTIGIGLIMTIVAAFVGCRDLPDVVELQTVTLHVYGFQKSKSGAT